MKTSRRFTQPNRFLSFLRLASGLTLISAAAAMALVALDPASSFLSNTQSQAKAKAQPSTSRLLTLQRDLETALGRGESGEGSRLNGPEQERYDNIAYPKTVIAEVQRTKAAKAAKALDKIAAAPSQAWQLVGPNGVPADALVASESTGASAGTIFSGRATAIAVAPNCSPASCTMFIGAAGGGIWKTSNALAATPTWKPNSDGIPSNAIGSIAFDPNDATSNTLYVGTGEPNGSSDSEAGVGLYKSIDGGNSWSLVAGSTAANAPCADNPSSLTCPVATGRSIGAVAIDPANASHIFIGTDVARHGASSVIGGRFTPPGSAQVGLYESTDGGATFTAAEILPQDVVAPSTANGLDFFRGGCSHVELYRSGSETQVYASFFDYGVFRRSSTQDGDTAFHQIFESFAGGSPGASSLYRTEFSLAPNGSDLRVYAGDGGVGNSNGPLTGLEATFWRVDNANVPAATLFTGGSNGGWTQLSSSTNGTPGFGSFNYCTGQCSYDMPVLSPPGAPGTVYIGGALQYGELGGRSNGRGIQRSADAGVNFTDMTIDTSGTSLHPDQHAIASAPSTPDIVFIANDGGLWRLNGAFSDASSQCSGRVPPLTGADLTDCQHWLSAIPTSITSLNSGLATLQYQSLSYDPSHPTVTLLGGTQDNGTHLRSTSSSASWSVNIFGDGGQSGISPFNSNIRFHNFFNATTELNFQGDSETGWDVTYGPFATSGEAQSFYIPAIFDPKVNGTMFAGLNFVWRTQDHGGGQTYLDAHCNRFTGDFAFGFAACGDWVRLENLGSTYALASGSHWGTDKASGGFVAATVRAPSDNGTLWVGTRRGRVFVTSNADAADPSTVAFYRIDTSSQPTRFVSGIDVDPANPNHAFISYSGYDAYAIAAGTATGHVFEVTYNPTTHAATWSGDLSSNLGDQPLTGIAVDWQTNNVYVATDFGVFARRSGKTNWQPAGHGLPPVAVYGLTINVGSRVLYAATHGRSAWMLSLH